MADTWANIGSLHAVKCEWCRLKMSCNCFDGNNPKREGHIIILCPRCQVTDLGHMIFGEKVLREILLSKIQEAQGGAIQRTDRMRQQLKLVSREPC